MAGSDKGETLAALVLAAGFIVLAIVAACDGIADGCAWKMIATAPLAAVSYSLAHDAVVRMKEKRNR